MPVKMQCPKCESHSIDPSMSTAQCSPCSFRWKDWISFCIEMGSKGKKISYKEFEEPEPEPDYVESGDFARDVENLVDMAVEKAIVLERMNIFDRLEYEVRQITLAGGELPLSRIYNMVTKCLADAKSEWERINDDD